MMTPALRAVIRKLETSLGARSGSLIGAALRLRHGATRSYAVGGRKILLPGSHRLPHYQKANRLYDRFLPWQEASNRAGRGMRPPLLIACASDGHAIAVDLALSH